MDVSAALNSCWGWQDFITIIALLQQRRALLKRENFRVIFNYFHPRWYRHGKIFSEPRDWPREARQRSFWPGRSRKPESFVFRIFYDRTGR